MATRSDTPGETFPGPPPTAPAVYAAGLVRGIALVTFRAASTIFTSPRQYGLSSTQYGTMFLPQAVTAVAGSLLGGGPAQRFGTKRVFLAGLFADLASMVLLIISQFFTSSQPLVSSPGRRYGPGRGLYLIAAADRPGGPAGIPTCDLR